MPDPTIRRDALDLTGCTDAERAAILSADRLWIETLPADDGSTQAVLVRVVGGGDPLDESDHRDRIDRDGEVWHWHGDENWDAWPALVPHSDYCGWPLKVLSDKYGPLRFAESDA